MLIQNRRDANHARFTRCRLGLQVAALLMVLALNDVLVDVQQPFGTFVSLGGATEDSYIPPRELLFPQETTTSAAAEEESSGDLPLWAQAVLVVVLLALSGMFAGLTMGIMGIDTLTLEIIADAGSEPDKTYARTLLPVRKLGHQALSTLVLGNMWCNVMIAQYGSAFDFEGGSDDGGSSSGIGGLVAFAVSTLLILIFTEIIPMSFCKSKHALFIAAKGVPILRIFIVLFYPVAKPLGWLLDKLIPHDIGQIYDRNELKKLMSMHTEQHAAEAGMDSDEGTLIIGALEFAEKTVSGIMTPIDSMYCVCADRPIDQSFIQELWRVGYSRIPVIDPPNRRLSPDTPLTVDDKQRVVGILYLKDLITYQPTLGSAEEGADSLLTVGEFIHQRVEREVQNVYSEAKLPTVMKLAQSGIAHLLLVREKPVSRDYLTSFVSPLNKSGGAASGGGGTDLTDLTQLLGRVVGVVTIEDVIEALLRAPIFDEGDSDADQEMQVIDATATSPTPAKPRKTKVNMFEMRLSQKAPHSTPPLTDSQLGALANFLSATVPCFAYWRLARIKALLEEAEDVRIVPPPSYTEALKQREETGSTSAPGTSSGPSCAQTFLLDAPPECVLYKAGVPSSDFTLVLHGCLELSLGKESLRGELPVMTFVGETLIQRTEEEVSKYHCRGGGLASVPGSSIADQVPTTFEPNFSARVTVPTRLLRITGKTFAKHCAAAIQNVPVIATSSATNRVRRVINLPSTNGTQVVDLVPVAREATKMSTTINSSVQNYREPPMKEESRRTYSPSEESLV